MYSIFKNLLVTALFVLIAITPGRALVLGPDLTFNIETGQVYSSKNPFDRWYPASLTKMMTAYTVLRQVKAGKITLQSPVRISPNALSKPPSKMGFPVGTILNFEAALKIILVKSANDVATAIAESAGGSEFEFARLMNRYSKEIGMADSHWVNPHGLHDVAQYSSAHDLGVLARQIYNEFPQHAELFGLQAIKVGRRTFRNHNALMRQFDGTIGMKTGFICAGGISMVVSVESEEGIIVSVVLGGQTSKHRNVKAAQLLTHALTQTQARPFVHFDEMPQYSSPSAPIDIRPQVCSKKRTLQSNLMFEDEAIEYFPIKGPNIAQLYDTLLSGTPEPYEAILVKLGNATGPDPFELLVEKPPIILADESTEMGETFQSDERYTLANEKVVAIPTQKPST